jgi:Icc-related predicted phosphoesterase
MVKIAAISDTHNQHRDLVIPECDILIHAGDYSYTGDYQSIWEINEWFGKLKSSGLVKEIATVCGNHDWGFQTNPSLFRSIMTNCTYLQDEPTEIMGLRFYGSPRTPEFCNWAFNEKRGEDIKRWWDRIPDDTQVLVTHGPPFGILDQVWEQPYTKMLGPEHLGCEELRKRVDNLPNLLLSVFGHIHSSTGEYRDDKGKIFINAAICTEEYKPINLVRVVELNV